MGCLRMKPRFEGKYGKWMLLTNQGTQVSMSKGLFPTNFVSLDNFMYKRGNPFSRYLLAACQYDSL